MNTLSFPPSARYILTMQNGRKRIPGDKAISGTYVRIWRTVSKIPRGRVASYGTVARVSGFPHQPRMAGYALHHLPPGSDIPWHRVINAQGRVSLPGASGDQQRRLLEREGVVFIRGKIDLKRFGWKKGL